MARQIMCEHPVFILNPAFRDAILDTGKYCYDGVYVRLSEIDRLSYHYEFPYYKFFPKVIDNLQTRQDDFYGIDSDGEIVPMFLATPCRKCVLCRNRNSNEWMFRAIAETQYSSCVPYFVTLTYDNGSLPENGVNKEDLQLFFKRLRQNLSRKFNYTEKVRYFAVSEYGKNTHRAHYHLILWNMPSGYSDISILHVIQDAWSVKQRVYNRDTKRYDWQLVKRIGFCYVKPCNVGGIQYVMKYMRKPCPIPKGQNETFYLSSRRPGIGAKWCMEHSIWFYQNADVLTVELVDKFTGERFCSFLPSYFRRKLYPCPSALVKKEVRDAIQLLDYYLSIRSLHYHATGIHLLGDTTDGIKAAVTECHPYYRFYQCKHRFPKFIWSNYKMMYKHLGDDIYLVLNSIIDHLTEYVVASPVDIAFWRTMQAAKTTYQDALSKQMSTTPEIDITYVKYKLEQAQILAESKEIL